MAPTVIRIKRQNGVAGQITYTATVQYPGEEISAVAFVGNPYGTGGIVMVTASGMQTFVTDPERFGPKLCPAWVRAFFGN